MMLRHLNDLELNGRLLSLMSKQALTDQKDINDLCDIMDELTERGYLGQHSVIGGANDC